MFSKSTLKNKKLKKILKIKLKICIKPQLMNKQTNMNCKRINY